MTIDDLKKVLEGSDLGAALPDLNNIVDGLAPIMKTALMAGPIILLALGLMYLFVAPKEANYTFGYRCYFGMGSEQAWRFTQRIAGITWTVLGAIMTVAMLIVTGRFPGQDVLEMLTTAGTCVVVEALVLLVATLVIRITVAAVFDRHGERRRK